MNVALVTGGGGVGSGSAIARRFAREGSHVVVCDIDETAARKVVDSITASGGKAAYRVVNVRARDQLADAFAFAQSLGPISAVVNNASALDAFHPEEPLEYWDEIVETEFLGAVRSTRLAIEALRAAGGGAVINVSSTSALPSGRQSGSPLYDISKGAIWQLSRRLAFLKSENIRVNCIVPHWIATPHIVEYVAGLTPAQRAEGHVPDRLTPVDEIADEVYKLATDASLAGETIYWPEGNEPRLLSI